MKRNIWVFTLIILFALVIPTWVYPSGWSAGLGLGILSPAVHYALPIQELNGDRLVLGDSYTLQSGETLNGSLIVMGGNANIQAGAVVGEDVVILGGSLRCEGAVDGDILALGGLVELGESAHIRGDVTSVSGNLRRDAGSLVDGEVHTSIVGPLELPLPGGVNPPPSATTLPQVVMNEGLTIWDGLFFFFRSFMWAALAVLTVLFAPKQAERIARAVTSAPLIAGGLGLLTLMIAPFLLVIVFITIIGIPIGLAAILFLSFTWIAGLMVLGCETGKRLARLLNQEWALPVSAAIGTFLLTLVINGIAVVVPCIGWIAPALVGSVGLGATLLTIFGTRDYPLELQGPDIDYAGSPRQASQPNSTSSPESASPGDQTGTDQPG